MGELMGGVNGMFVMDLGYSIQELLSKLPNSYTPKLPLG